MRFVIEKRYAIRKGSVVGNSCNYDVHREHQRRRAERCLVEGERRLTSSPVDHGLRQFAVIVKLTAENEL